MNHLICIEVDGRHWRGTVGMEWQGWLKRHGLSLHDATYIKQPLPRPVLVAFKPENAAQAMLFKLAFGGAL